MPAWVGRGDSPLRYIVVLSGEPSAPIPEFLFFAAHPFRILPFDFSPDQRHELGVGRRDIQILRRSKFGDGQYAENPCAAFPRPCAAAVFHEHTRMPECAEPSRYASESHGVFIRLPRQEPDRGTITPTSGGGRCKNPIGTYQLLQVRCAVLPARFPGHKLSFRGTPILRFVDPGSLLYITLSSTFWQHIPSGCRSSRPFRV